MITNEKIKNCYAPGEGVRLVQREGKAYYLIRFEKDFGYTMKRDTDLASLISKGVAYNTITDELRSLATSYQYSAPVLVPENETWQLPVGVFRKCGGPS